MKKLNVSDNIHWYLYRIVVTLELRKEHLNTVTCNIPVLPQMKNCAVWYMEGFSMSTYTLVTNFKTQSGFFGPPCIHTMSGKKRPTLFCAWL